MARRPRRGIASARATPVPPGKGLPSAAPAEFVSAPLELALKVLPELGVVGVAVTCALMPSASTAPVQDTLVLIALVEGAFCVVQGTLTDLSTRLRQPPPGWLAPILLGMVVTSLWGPAVSVAKDAGVAALLGIAWSVVERLRELWTMPRASRLEKLRRRALVGGRLSLLMLFAAAGAALMIGSYLQDSINGGARVVAEYLAWFLAAYFSLTALDVVRVHRAAFAHRPRTLLRFDPLGVEYLAPV